MRGVSREIIVAQIYCTPVAMGNRLTDDRKLLIDTVNNYGNASKQGVTSIKREAEMTLIADTITEHYINIGIEQGLEQGEISGQLKNLKEMHDAGYIPDDVFHAKYVVLKRELDRLNGE